MAFFVLRYPMKCLVGALVVLGEPTGGAVPLVYRGARRGVQVGQGAVLVGLFGLILGDQLPS